MPSDLIWHISSVRVKCWVVPMIVIDLKHAVEGTTLQVARSWLCLLPMWMLPSEDGMTKRVRHFYWKNWHSPLATLLQVKYDWEPTRLSPFQVIRIEMTDKQILPEVYIYIYI